MSLSVLTSSLPQINMEAHREPFTEASSLIGALLRFHVNVEEFTFTPSLSCYRWSLVHHTLSRSETLLKSCARGIGGGSWQRPELCYLFRYASMALGQSPALRVHIATLTLELRVLPEHREMRSEFM